MLTKPLISGPFLYLRNKLLGITLTPNSKVWGGVLILPNIYPSINTYLVYIFYSNYIFTKLYISKIINYLYKELITN
jgi:hypothetical protein